MMTIKKCLMAWVLALPLAFSSCLSSANSEPDPMAPGIMIYDLATSKHSVGFIPADAAIRLALVVGEAKAQGFEGDPLEVTDPADNTKKVINYLFDSYSTKITRMGTKYTIHYSNGNVYPFIGDIVIDTNGFETLEDGDGSGSWTISTVDFSYQYPGLNGTTVNYEFAKEGVTTLSGDGGYYTVTMNNLSASTGSSLLLEKWSGSYYLQTAHSLAYSQCHEYEFKLNGSAADTYFSWRGENVTYKGVKNNYTNLIGYQLLSGTVTARIMSTDYDQEYYPSPLVQVVFSNNGQSYQITYNGLVSSSN